LVISSLQQGVKERSVSLKFNQLRPVTNVHVLGEAVEVLLLLLELGLKLQKLLTLTAANGVVLVSLLAALEGIAGEGRALVSGLMNHWNRCDQQLVTIDTVLLWFMFTYPWPPALGGAPVSPAAMARALVTKVALRGRRAAVLVKVVRSILMRTYSKGW
jgi:hypothetical protein